MDTAHIRNFSIIAHIDHGKTTLTDVFLRLTNTVSAINFEERMMDSNPIEKEKGVTIKLAPVRMSYAYKGKTYEMNLIDTPGHVDFGYEVSRSLAACEGAILLIDATQGIQAQTLAHFTQAKKLGLKIIPVINKIDLPAADVDQIILECLELLDCNESDILRVSAKTGEGVEAVLQNIIEKVPPPDNNLYLDDSAATGLSHQAEQPPRALIITSVFDNHQGAIAYVRVVDGVLRKEPLYLFSTDTSLNPIEVGFFSPKRFAVDELKTGEVGYVATGLKEMQFLKIGDTITTLRARGHITPLPGYKEPTPMVYMELYPIDANDFAALKDAMSKLILHDSALQYTATNSLALGNGLRVGFLGIFHAEVVRERLQQEWNLNLIATAPTVPYQLKLRGQNQPIIIHNPAELPDPSQIEEIAEPMTKTMIFTPETYVSNVIKLVREKRGELINSYSTGNRVRLEYLMPLSELITDFHDNLKSVSSGYASLEYELVDYQKVDAVKVTIMVNHEPIEALSFMTTADRCEFKARNIVKKLKDVIPRQLFEIPIQAALGGKVIARETVKAYRKDVTAKLYGGDRTRRMKLLKKQSEGKKKMKQIGKVELNQEAFLAVLSS